MKASALTLLVGLVMASSAHAQCKRHFASTSLCNVGDPAAPTDPNTFVYKICKLNTTVAYDPGNLTASYQSPTCDGTAVDVSQTFRNGLAAAFTLAPDDVKKNLCALRHVFVTPSASFPQALGIWEVSPDSATSPVRQRGNGAVYIAIPDTVLTSAKSLLDAENALLVSLFPSTYSSSSLPQFTSQNAPASDPGAGVLAVLAHELGHLLLADVNADGTGGMGSTVAKTHPRSDLSCAKPPAPPCFEGAFLGAPGAPKRWNAKSFHDNMRRWIKFTENGNQNKNKHQNSAVDFKDTWDNIKTNPKGYPAIRQKIKRIYNSGELVSVFAAVSPEEDFVETYKYKVLANANLSLTIDFRDGTSTSTKDVIQVVKNAIGATSGDLHDKIKCVP
jgi:hypothetical protein